MGKLVKKTVAITLAAIFGVVLIVFGIFTIAAPKEVGDVFDSIGSYSISRYFYERKYLNSRSFDDLVFLVTELDEKNDVNRTYTYASLILDAKYSEEYKAYADDYSKKGFESKEKCEEFFYGKCVVAKVLHGDAEEAYTFAEDFRKEYGYVAGNPYSIILSETADNMSDTELTRFKEVLQTVKSKTTKTVDRNRVNEDLKQLDKIIENKGK